MKVVNAIPYKMVWRHTIILREEQSKGTARHSGLLILLISSEILKQKYIREKKIHNVIIHKYMCQKNCSVTNYFLFLLMGIGQTQACCVK